MLSNDTIEATDLYAMVFSEDCKCESKHQGSYPPCTGSVVAKKVSCIYPAGFNICRSSFEWNKGLIARGVFCADCGRLARDCWKVVAI